MRSLKAGVATITSLARKGLFALLLLGSGAVFAQNPSASFTSNVFSGCAPLSVDFTNLSTNATSYFWDFGNGNTSVLPDPTTIYLTPGFYTVTLVAVNNASGLRDTLTAVNYIRVVDDPIPDFTAAPLTGCAGNNLITFTNLSTNATSYIWDFGDGTFSTQANPTHTYTSTGVYTVKLIARNAFTCTKVKVRTAYITIVPNPPATFTVNQQSSCDPTTVFQFNATTPGASSWLWDFGDGNTSTLQSPSHVYGTQGTYDVSLIVTNASGCTDTLVQPAYINIGASLVPTFTVNSQTGCPPFNAQFTCNVPNATSWSWDFGNGVTSTVQNPSHLYTSPGQYTITLSVTTASGCNGSAVYPAHITIDTLPVPSFTPSAASGCAPLQTTFNNTTSSAVSYLWDLGNGTSSTDVNPSVTYTTAGTYPVTLTATSANGCQVSYTDSFAVTVNDITATINGTPRIGCAPLAVTANGTSTPSAVSWSWDFGDGTTGSGASVPHVYTNIGNYTVTLIATSAAGCTDTVVKPAFFKVVDDTTIYTVPDTMLVCLPPGTVSFTDPTIGSNSWIWYWGNGDSSTVKNPTYTYSAPGFYTVSLVTGMAGGCRQYINPIAIVEVVPFIVSPIVSVITSPCGPFTVQLDNQTLNVASYLWDFGDGNTSTLQNPVHTYANPGTYTITLLLTSISGCQTTLSTTVTFGHTAPIVASDDQLCLGTAVDFSLTPAAAFVSAVWDFGDGNSLNSLNPSYVYGSTGIYTVSVTVTDTNGCVFSYTYPTPIEVTDPQPSFILNQPTVGCSPFTVQFNNTSTGATGYYWNFGDGDTSVAVSPSHTYTVAGTYTVTLIATAPGCVDSVVMTNLITVNAAVANFTFTPSSGCLPLTVTFTDMSTSPVSWFWDFGDGTTSTLQNPVHTYVTEPTGLVALTIVDANGCTKIKRKPNVTIIRPDIIVSDSVGCRPFTVAFSTTLAATSYLWDFGDGTTSSQQNPSHTYTQTGSYTVTLTTVLASGCTTSLVKPNFIQVTAPVAEFMSPTVAVCAPSLVNFVNQSTGAATYLWDFGDGSTSTSTDPAHIYNAPGSYTITLIAYSSNGCTDTMIKPNYIVVPGTLTIFTPSDTVACANSLIQFTDQSLNASQWFWDFGDGTTSTQQSPGHVYLTAGTYTVTLITNDSIGCSSFYTYPTQIDINPIPDAVGSVGNTVGCNPFTTSFTNSSTGAATYLWTFGDGGTSANANPTYTYNNAGVFQVSLIAYSSNGCSDTIQLPSSITVHQTPSARFLRSVNSGCEPLTVSFTNQSTSLNGATYFWDFGNGQTSTLQDPVMLFTTAGVYNVTLTVTNTGGCTSTYTRPVTVLATPVAGATLSGNGGCSPYQVTFTNTSTGAATYNWDFGNGSTSTATNPVNTYANAGSFQVTLVATASNGCTDTFLVPNPIVVDQTPAAAFSRNPSSGCVPVTVTMANNSSLLNNPTYLWDFGNGTTSTAANPTVTYTTAGTYTITLTVTNSGGCSSTVTRTVNAHPAPLAQAVASGISGCTPYQVTFNNTTSGATTYLWDFGNGTTSTATQPSVVYSNPGSYNVSLIATSGNGCTDTLQLAGPIVVSQTPSAAFSRNPSSGCAPVTVNFSNNSSQLNGTSYLWDFGNGQTSTAQDPVFTYTVPGTYTVLLQVTNAGGCVDTVSKTVIVRDVPVASATVSDTISCGPVTVNFTNTSTGATGYVWSFGDGATSSLTAPSHQYSTPGVYTVTLIASTAQCSDTLVLPQTVTILEKPVASFTPAQASGCTPLSVTFTSNSVQMTGATYAWVSGNGTPSSQATLSAVYSVGGTYDVQLIVTNPNGCSDTVIHQATAYDDPVADGFTADTVGCQPHTASFINNSVNAASYIWDFGDGTTSSQTDPVHTYTNPGTYTVTLTAMGNGSCGDTVVLSKTIRVFRTPAASFTPSVLSGCTSLNVSFNNTSTQLDNPVYAWSFGDGTTSNAQNPSVTYTVDGMFTVELVVTNSGGCSDSATTVIDSDITPVADASVSVSGNCLPVTATFTNQSTNAVSYLWVFGDGNTSTLQSPAHNYTTAGSFQPYLIAWSAAGCSDTLLIPVTINASQVPVAGYTISQNAGCSGTSFAFTNTSTPSAGLNYQWTIAGGTYNTASPAVTLTNPGVFGVSLVVTNAAGCADTLDDPFAIQVYDTLPPLVSPIVSVSVKSDSQVEITWQNNAALDLGAYVLYRLNPTSGQFVEIYRDVNPQNSATNVTSVYTDNGLNTLSSTYTYILQTLDRCSYTLPLSALTPHTTINVSAAAAGQNVIVQWTPYAGCPVGSYEINRVEGGTGSATLVATVPAGTLSWVDTAFYCPGLYTYRITATSLCGTTYTSLSDTASAIPASPLQGQTVEMVRSTVVDDRDVLTEWLAPVIAPDRVVEYHVYRSDNNSSFILIGTVPAGVLSYLDTDVEVHEQNYFYRIEAVNDCQVQTLLSNRSSSIYLQSEFNRNKIHLWWTEYIYWDTGVDYYVIEQEVQPGIWNPVKTVPGNVTDTEVDF